MRDPLFNVDDIEMPEDRWPGDDIQFDRAVPDDIQSTARRLVIVSASSLASQPVPRRYWHVEGMIPAGTVTSLYGDGGTGKSLLALQLAVATVSATAWLGLEVEPGPVIFLTAEDDIGELHRRLDDICQADGLDLMKLDHLSIIPLAGEDAVLAAPDRGSVLKTTALYQSLAAAVDSLRPRLVVLDTLADLFAGNEVDRAQVRQFIGMLRGIAIRCDTTVLLLAHPSLAGMSSGTGSSGSTAWNGSVRSRLYMRRVTSRDGDRIVEDDPDVRTLTTVKANYGRAGDDIMLKWERGRFVPHGSSGRPASGLDAIGAQSRLNRMFRDLVAAYVEEGRPVTATMSRNYAPVVFAADSRSEGTGKKALEAAMNRLLATGELRIEDTGPPSKRRQHLTVAPPVSEEDD